MPRTHPFISAFNAGEFSENMAARTDFGLYPKAAEILENMFALVEGGITRRPGTRFVEEVADSTVKTKLQRFEYSITQAYILEFGDYYARAYRNQGRIIYGATASVTNGDFISGLSGWGDISNGTGAISWNSDGYMALTGAGVGNEAIAEQPISVTTLNVVYGLQFRVRGRQGLKLKVRVGSTSGLGDILAETERGIGYHVVPITPSVGTFYIQFLFEGSTVIGVDDVDFSGTVMEIPTPYSAAEAFVYHAPQSADTLYIFHPDHPTHKLLRYDNDNWSIEQVDWLDGPYQAVNTESGKTLQPSAATGNDITISASGHSPFNANSVGQLIRISNPADTSTTSYGWAIIKTVVDGNTVTADIRGDFPTANASATWRLGAWTAARGYPSSGVFFEQRLMSANNDISPQNFWGSKSADFENMAPSGTDGTVTDASALDFIIAAEQVNVIVWMREVSAGLVIGTVGAEWLVSSTGAIVTPTDISVKRHATKGSYSTHEPIAVGESLLFIQRAQRKILEARFAESIQGLQVLDTTRLADHITRGKIDKMVFAQEPDNLLWAVRGDGQMPVMTFVREEEIVSWARMILGGSFGTGDTVVESVAMIPTTDRDEVWVIAKRTINGVTKRYVEFFEAAWESGDDQEDAFYVDCGLTYEGSAATVISGLDHLEGQTCKIWGDGAVLPDVTVSGGQVELTTSVTKAQIGLAYRHKYRTLKIDSGGSAGTSVGKQKRIFKLTMVVLNAHTMEIGVSSDNLVQFDFRVVADEMDQFVPFFTGERQIEFEGEWEGDPRINVEGEDPAPFTLLGIAPEIEVHDVK